MFEYQAAIDKIIDGDTFDAKVDLGFHTYSKQRFRLIGYSAPEVRGSERNMGLIAKKRLEELLAIGTTITLKSEKTEKFGRWLAEIPWTNGQTLSEFLIAEGYGLSWNGKGKRPQFDPEQYLVFHSSQNRQ